MFRGSRFVVVLACALASVTSLGAADPAPVDGMFFSVDSVSAMGTGPNAFHISFRDLTAVPTAFQVQYSPDPFAIDEDWSDIGPILPARKLGTNAGGTRSLDVSVPLLAPSANTIEYFRVRAIVAHNTPLASTPADAVNGPWAGPDGAFLGPAPPTQVAVTLSGNYPLVTWTNNVPPSDLLWAGEYVYRKGPADSGYVLIATPGTLATSFLDTAVSPNTKYSYEVASYRQGYVQAAIEISVSLGTPFPVSVTTPNAPPPPAPNPPAALGAVAMGSTQIQLSWTDNSANEDGFVVERSTDGGATFAARATINIPNTVSYLDKNLLPGLTYTYRIRSFNSGGNSAPSNIAAATTPSLPPPTWESPDASVQNQSQTYQCAIWGLADYSAGVRDVFVIVIDTVNGTTTGLPLATVNMTTHEWRIDWHTYDFKPGRYHLKAYSHNANGGLDLYSGPANVIGWTVDAGSTPCSVTNP